MSKIEQHSWFSTSTQQNMDVVAYGHGGKPVIVFPSQCGKARDFEGFGMVEACRKLIEEGKIRLFCIDTIDDQSWANWNASPALRALRHEDYDRYVTTEVYPFVLSHYHGEHVKCLATGCSMGAYHAGNFYFRHPDVFDTAICLSGLFQLNIFVGDYMDENVYLNCPLYYLPNLQDPFYLDAYEKGKIIICAGQGAWEDLMIADARAMGQVLNNKNIPHWVDLWGYDVCHDWPWWQKQLPYFLGHRDLGL
jgi:esterase/lipase superfamily enzyme